MLYICNKFGIKLERMSKKMINISLQGKLLIDSLYFIRLGKDGKRKVLVHLVLSENKAERTHSIIPVYITSDTIQDFIFQNLGLDGAFVEVKGEFKVRPTFVKNSIDSAESFIELSTKNHHIKLIEDKAIKRSRLSA